MKIELGIKTHLTVFILLIATSQSVIYAGGNQGKNTEAQPAQEMRRFLYSIPEVRPDWVDTVPQSVSEFYFIGTSQHYNNAANARNDARENARNQVLKFYGEFIERQAVESGSLSGVTGDTLEAFIMREDEIISYAENVIDQVATDRYYTEVYINKNNQEEYIVYTLNQISKRKAEEDIANFAGNISQRYAAMLTPKTTLKSTLEDYITVVRALQQNTLHRITAYHEGAAGRVGLYGHALSSIIDLINSIDIMTIPNRTARKPDTLDTIIRFHSAKMSNIGPFNCRVTLYGSNLNVPAYYIINNENTILIQNRTSSLEPGIYTVQIELLLQDVTGNTGRNINSGFTFEVMPLTYILGTRTEIETGIKRAVDTLANRLRSQTETRIGLFSLTGTDIPTGLSRFLTERVRHYMIENPDRKYRIRNENIEIENNQIAVFSGFFTKRGDHVDITLELNTHNGEEDGSQFFSISVETLNGLGISIEPENLAVLPEEPFIEPQRNQLNIQAFFNSPSLTYLHRDELGITLMADKNCYFKVIHIDADNQMTMIYPNSVDRNNYLRANTPRAIFESAKIYLYEPYGAETIIVVASTAQFANIEQDYIAPLMPATPASVRAAIRGNYNDQSEGEAFYTITILKPHEEYEYGRPENMRDFVDTLRNYIRNQGGVFEGNETSGVYTVNNIRGSYRISRNAPDKIQFAVYNMDNFTDGTRSGIQTRGAGFTFSFTRPLNMTQVINTVRAGIEGKGGTFTGNEQQGNFKVSGITGQYQVSDMVNVTITDKPFLIPNSLIEREVKNYFGQR